MFRFQNYNKSPKEKRTYNGIVYDSVSEMKRGIMLEEMQKEGKISNLQRQVSFELLAPFTDYTGKKQRGIYYFADFVYERDGKIIVEDVKSHMTVGMPEYKLKKKLFLSRYPQYSFEEYLSR